MTEPLIEPERHFSSTLSYATKLSVTIVIGLYNWISYALQAQVLPAFLKVVENDAKVREVWGRYLISLKLVGCYLLLFLLVYMLLIYVSVDFCFC